MNKLQDNWPNYLFYQNLEEQGKKIEQLIARTVKDAQAGIVQKTRHILIGDVQELQYQLEDIWEAQVMLENILALQ